jgi:C_GCAxxG_C_C family probable redox protein
MTHDFQAFGDIIPESKDALRRIGEVEKNTLKNTERTDNLQFLNMTSSEEFMNPSEEAKSLFEEGYNCAQSMLYKHGKDYFAENKLALKLASGFGAGVSYRGEMCGAVSGALMVLGLRYGYSELSADTSAEMIFRITNEFMDTFEKRNGSIICKQLLQTDISTTEGLEYARQNGIFKKTCPNLVESASEILESLFEKNPI